jgi:hypothetical protein
VPAVFALGELAALRRDRVDLLHKEVRVAGTVTELVGGERFAGPPKTEAGRRTVAIPSTIVPSVSEHFEKISPKPETLLFPAPEGGYLQPGGGTSSSFARKTINVWRHDG